MQYHSTQHKTNPVPLIKACVGGYAADDGVYMPERIPQLPAAFFKNYAGMSLSETAYVVASMFFGGDVDSAILKDIVEKSYNFPIETKHIVDNVYVAELFHGPTLTCKDFGVRFMARMLRSVLPEGKAIDILVTTTGNTGSALAQAFGTLPNVNVHVLYPKGKLSRRQENEFATLGPRVHAIEVQGSLDDCKALERELLKSGDKVFGDSMVVSGNSLNICRVLPQVAVFINAVAQMDLKTNGKAIKKGLTLSLPCGNLGNLTAALISCKMGLPIKRIIAATGSNDTFNRFLQSGQLSPMKSVATLSYALDSGSNPVNLARILDLYGNDIDRIREVVVGSTCNDVDICQTINRVYDDYHYLLDPNSAVAWYGMEQYSANKSDEYSLVFATAHPAKSLDAMTAITSRPMELPLQLMKYMGGERIITKLPPTVTAFKRYLGR